MAVNKLLRFGSKMSPKGPSVEGVFPSNSIFRGRAFRKSLDYNDSDFRNVLIQCDSKLNELLSGRGTCMKWGLIRGSS